MLSRKRGISPLIASVLLIGFVIAIAAMVFIWWGDFVKQKAIKEGLQNDAQRDCMSYVDIDVKSAEVSDGKLKFVINNKGSKELTGFRIRVTDDNGVWSGPVAQKIESISQSEEFPVNDYTPANPTEAEVIPMILESSTEGSLAYSCTNKMVTVEIASS